MGYRWIVRFIHMATSHSVTPSAIPWPHGLTTIPRGPIQWTENTNILDRRDFTRQRLPLRAIIDERRKGSFRSLSSSSRICVNDSWESIYLRIRCFFCGLCNIITKLQDSRIILLYSIFRYIQFFDRYIPWDKFNNIEIFVSHVKCAWKLKSFKIYLKCILLCLIQ